MSVFTAVVVVDENNFPSRRALIQESYTITWWLTGTLPRNGGVLQRKHHLQIPVEHALAVTKIDCINELLEVSARLVLW